MGHPSGQYQLVVRRLLTTKLREMWTVRGLHFQDKVDSQPTGDQDNTMRGLCHGLPLWGLIQLSSESWYPQITFKGCSLSQAH